MGAIDFISDHGTFTLQVGLLHIAHKIGREHTALSTTYTVLFSLAQ